MELLRFSRDAEFLGTLYNAKRIASNGLDDVKHVFPRDIVSATQVPPAFSAKTATKHQNCGDLESKSAMQRLCWEKLRSTRIGLCKQHWTRGIDEFMQVQQNDLKSSYRFARRWLFVFFGICGI